MQALNATPETETTDTTATRAAAELRQYLAHLRTQFVERERETRGIMLALIARTHVFFGGPPGTAKSALVNAFADACGATYFVRLLMRQSVPEELFGPQDLLALREGRYERRIEGFLPTAEFAFLDECFKASPAILNALLTVMNERQFDQGSQRVDIPLQILAGASNELPDDPSLGALWDRFLLRFWVDGIGDEDAWEGMLFADEIDPGTLDTDALEAVREAADRVNARPIARQLRAIRKALAEDHGITPSDRRWKQSLKLIRASAALEGRDTATAADLVVLADCLWDQPKDRAPIYGAIAQNSNPELTRAMQLWDSVQEIVSDLGLEEMLQRSARPQDSVKLAQANTAVKRAAEEIDKLPSTTEIDPLKQRVHAAAEKVKRAGLRAMGVG